MPYHTIITVPYYLISYPSLLQSFNWSGSISAFSIYRNRRKSLFLRKNPLLFWRTKWRGVLFFFCSALLCNFMFSCHIFRWNAYVTTIHIQILVFWNLYQQVISTHLYTLPLLYRLKVMVLYTFRSKNSIFFVLGFTKKSTFQQCIHYLLYIIGRTSFGQSASKKQTPILSPTAKTSFVVNTCQ